VPGVLIDLCLAVGLGLLLLVSLTLTLALAVAQTADQRLFGEPLPRAVTVLFTPVYAVAPVLVSLLVFAVLYRVAARTVLTWRTVLPGALLAAVAFEIIKVGFAQYAARGGASTTIGALGGVVAVLALPHFGAQITLFGAVFARVYHDLGGSPAVCPYHRGHTAHQPDLIRRGRIPGAAAHRLPEPHERRVGGTSVNGDSAAPLAAAAAVGLLGAAVLLTPWLRQTLRRRARHWHHRHRPEH
jgi:uncharacterized BrkB/YihY/UPF0761 family membrane protein